jgi:hypothetical protein
MFKYTFRHFPILKINPFNFTIYFYLLFCKIVVQSILLSFFSKHLLYNSYILSFDNLVSVIVSLIGSFLFGFSSLLLVLNKLRAIALPTPNPNPCFIESNIEGDFIGASEGEFKGVYEGAGAGAGAGARRGGGGV